MDNEYCIQERNMSSCYLIHLRNMLIIYTYTSSKQSSLLVYSAEFLLGNLGTCKLMLPDLPILTLGLYRTLIWPDIRPKILLDTGFPAKNKCNSI